MLNKKKSGYKIYKYEMETEEQLYNSIYTRILKYELQL